MSLIRVQDLRKYFPVRTKLFGREIVRAVDGVSFEIERGETFGLVGESGSGKSTLGRCILRLLSPTSGRIWLDGVDLTAIRGEELRKVRRKMQIVFQNPTGSLNPRRTAGASAAEPFTVHERLPPVEAAGRVRDLFRRVGLPPEIMDKYPHELSGGQCQRVAIARSLALEPEFLVLDEPTSSLDVSVQAQIVNLLKELQRDLGLTYLFITHDLSLVSYLADRVAVMYLGKIVEMGEATAVLDRGRHPYTMALRSAAPVVGPDRTPKPPMLRGEMPSALRPPSGCRFRTRCRWAADRCATEEPILRELEGNEVACHFAESIMEVAA